MTKLIYAFILALPDLFKFLKELEKKQKEQATARRIKEDIKTINKAFENEDAEALNNLFNS